jgi:hypothetical protein
MDVIGFLCISLGSSRVQLRDSLGSSRTCSCSEAAFSSHNGDCANEEQRSIVRFLWAKGLNAKAIHKEMFHIYGGKCLSLKKVHNCVEKFCEGRSKVADGETEVQNWPRQKSKDSYSAGFNALVKGWTSW